jgi:PE-PGRS C-terminal aspartyl peptidase-like domain
MAGRDGANGNKQPRNAQVRRRRMVMGGAVGAFIAAAAMATGSAVTAAPAKADFEDLLDPIIQPILTSLTDSLAGFDPAAAVDVTSWTDSLLSSLNSIDLALPSIAEPAAAAAASADPAAAPADATIPLTVLEGTEPAVNASVDGGSSVPLLVDTGSSGLVIPYTDLGSTTTQQLTNLFDLGFPTGFSESGYSGGVDYLYLTYNDVPVDYLNGSTDVLSTNGPVDIEVYSWDPSNFGSLFTNDAFQNFLTSNDVNGILGIGENTSGPTTSPFESYGGVTVDVPQSELIVGSTDPITGGTTVDGAPISNLYETVTNGGSTTGSSVSDDVDSGGVFGTIPSTLNAEPGSIITVYTSQGGTELYQYTVGSGEVPTSTTGTSIDSGVEPFLTHELYINYATDQMTIGPSIT